MPLQNPLQNPLSLFLKEHFRESVLILLIGGALLYFYHRDAVIPESAPVISDRKQQAYMEKIIVHQYDQSQLSWILKAEDATVFEKSEVLHLHQIEMNSLGSPQKSGPSQTTSLEGAETQLLANQADVDWKQETIELAGNIQLFRPSGLEIRAQQASYHYPVGTVLIPDEVTVTQGDHQMLGKDLVYQLKEARFHIKRVVMAY